jgi:hypothetical protein
VRASRSTKYISGTPPTFRLATIAGAGARSSYPYTPSPGGALSARRAISDRRACLPPALSDGGAARPPPAGALDLQLELGDPPCHRPQATKFSTRHAHIIIRFFFSAGGASDSTGGGDQSILYFDVQIYWTRPHLTTDHGTLTAQPALSSVTG